MFRKVLASALVGGSLLATAILPASASVAVPRPTLTQCIFEGRAMQNGRGNVFDAADRAYAGGSVAYFQAVYNSWVPNCHLEDKWAHELHTERSAAEAAYVDSITP